MNRQPRRAAVAVAACGNAAPKSTIRQDFDTFSDEVMLSGPEVAELLGVSQWTVKDWRFKRRGPPPIKLNRSLRYRCGDVRVWIASCRNVA